MIFGNNKKLASNGFTIIEVMAAVAVLSIGLIGGLTVITGNLRSITTSDNRVIAAGLAAEGIELVRNVRDTNWLQGVGWKDRIEGDVNPRQTIKFFCTDSAISDNLMPEPADIDDATRCSGVGNDRPCQIYIYTKSADNSKCYSDNFGDRSGYSRTPTNFFRLIKLDDDLSANSVKVTVTVKWVSGTQNYVVTASETLYNWK